MLGMLYTVLRVHLHLFYVEKIPVSSPALFTCSFAMHTRKLSQFATLMFLLRPTLIFQCISHAAISWDGLNCKLVS